MTIGMTPIYHNNKHPYLERTLNLHALLDKKSHFLLGPRQTGKSFLIAHSLKGVRVYDLLDTTVYLALSQKPERLSQEIISGEHLVVIDEIQRLPILRPSV